MQKLDTVALIDRAILLYNGTCSAFFIRVLYYQMSLAIVATISSTLRVSLIQRILIRILKD
jgi:hypothetical protein